MLIELWDALSGAGGQLPSGADGPPVPLSASTAMRGDVARPSVAEGALNFRCCMCLLEFDEPWCSCCGAVLKYERAAGRSLSGPALPLRNGR